MSVEAGISSRTRYFSTLQLFLCIVEPGLSHVEAGLDLVIGRHAVSLILALTSVLNIVFFIIALIKEAERRLIVECRELFFYRVVRIVCPVMYAERSKSFEMLFFIATAVSLEKPLRSTDDLKIALG